MAHNKYPHVYSPIQVGVMTLKNRIQYSPIVSNHADFVTGRVNEELLAFLGSQAATGASLVTIGSTPIDFDRARDFYGCLSVTSPNDNPGLRLLTDEVHKYGSKLSTELTHGGQWAIPRSLDGKQAYVPSLVPGTHDPHEFKEITRTEMLEVIDNWKVATQRCIDTGFDMVMVHLAHGNLLSSFLSTHFNLRTDKYGGTPENRWRYPLEVIEAVYSVTKGKIPIELRVVADERLPDGTTIEERIAFLKEAQRYVDMIILSTGTLIYPEPFSYNMPSYYTEPGLNVPAAAAMKAALDIPVSVVGGISTLEQAEEIIASGKADIVAMAKALMADPKLVIKGERGQDDQIRPCMRCMYCLRGDGETHLSGCAVNPTLGWEYRYRYATPKPSSKKVAIAGGGPGGMKAARELTKRGCDVTLYEKADKLGGRFPEASSLWLKDGFRRYFKYAVRKTESCGAKIEKGVTLTPEILREQKPDVLIVATGGQSLRPNIPGIDGAAVYDVADVDRGLEVVGENVLVCGAGLSGTEAAFELARAGKKVSLVDMRPKEEIYDGFIFFMMPQILLKLKEFGITTYDRTKIKEFAEGKVVCEAEDGSTLELAADAFVLALGLAPDKVAIEALTDEVAESYIIGDAGGQGMIGDAVVQAYYACEQI